MTRESLLSKINGLDRRSKIFYISSVALSIALIVFGASVWLLDDSNEISSTLENLSVGETIITRRHDDQAADDDVAVITLSFNPTNFPSATQDFMLPTSSPFGLRATSISPTSEPSEEPTKEQSSNPSETPSLKPTNKPSNYPSFSPTTKPSYSPSDDPSSSDPTLMPSTSQPSSRPTLSSYPTRTTSPSDVPLFRSHDKPVDTDSTYFNYNTWDVEFGPSNWKNVTVLNSTENYWHEFGFDENMCGAGGQSPVDLCADPIRHCLEEHEFRSRPGDYTMSSNWTEKQILPNKLRVVMARRQGDEPDPPHTDFSAIGYKALDLLNIDIKFPSEHTLCGHVYDGEMQYFFFHPVRKSLIGIAWLFKADEVNATNDHMQILIDAFQQIYDSNQNACNHDQTGHNSTETLHSESHGSFFERSLRKAKSWDPFHNDIQKTVHFWGYTGSLTEPPCTDSVLWRVMDVPVKISVAQLYQMQNILFNNIDNATCTFTSNHYNGRVARPVSGNLRYYKCTRSDYVSDDERNLCGDLGCRVPFGKDLEPYIDPEIIVTGPPTEPPTESPVL